MALEITRKNITAGALRGLARRCKDTRQARRMLAIALVLEGASREAAARAAGMDRQTLRDWVHRFNAHGIDGLLDKVRPGRPPQLKEAQLRKLDAIVERGPDVATDKVVRWRCVDLKEVIRERFDVEISERHVGRILNTRGYRRLSARPRHPQADEAAQAVFKKSSRRR